MSKAVVFSRPIKPEWLDKTVEFLLQCQDEKQAKDMLLEFLSVYIKDRTNLLKTRSILARIWLEIDENKGLRDRALEVFKICNNSERLAVHWAMMLLAFPIFRDLCAIIGKLSDIQDEITLSQIKRRVYEVWGERSTLEHSIPKNIKTLRECGVLEQVKPGIYRVIKREVKNKDVVSLLIYAVLKSRDKLYYSVWELERFKELFPFIIDVSLGDLHGHDAFVLDRIGGETVVSIGRGFAG
ncbi:MAG: hypothetical protein PWR01_1722 [Clostridiales bacterium]|nr:hypothetical protein [Clostridiales bacterium]